MPPVMCYICGRDFGSKSIAIHIPNCEKKFEAQQKKLPKKERRAVPTRPDQFEKVISGELSGGDLQKFNEKAFDDYNTKSLDACPNCARTFNQNALAIHKKSCKPKDSGDLGPEKPKKKEAPKVNYPKFKKKSTGAEPTEEKKKAVTPPPQEEEEPNRSMIAQMLKDSAFDKVDNREKLMQLMKELSVQDALP